MKLIVNDADYDVDVEADTPLLWVLRDHLKMTGTKFGCGIAQCGACSVSVDGSLMRSCSVPVSAVEGRSITTIEGLSDDNKHPVQAAWIAENVPECGYCQSGQIMRAAALLAENPTPSREDIVQEMSANLCRCGTYNRIFKAVERAAKEV